MYMTFLLMLMLMDGFPVHYEKTMRVVSVVKDMLYEYNTLYFC